MLAREKCMLESTATSQSKHSQKPILQPMGVGGILDTALSLYRNNFGIFLRIVALYIVLTGLQEAVVVWLLERSNTPTLDNWISDVDDLLGNLAYIWCIGVCIVASSKIYLGRPVTFQAALREFRSRFLTYLGSSLLFLTPYTILVSDSIGMSTSMALIFLLSLPFFSVFYVYWVFYGHAILFEAFTSVAAFGRSRALVRGTWRRVCGIICAILFLDLAVFYILGNSIGIILVLAGVLQNGGLAETINYLFTLKYHEVRPTSLDLLVMYIVYLGAEAFTFPIYAIGVTLFYFDVRIRKEGFDIEIRVHNS